MRVRPLPLVVPCPGAFKAIPQYAVAWYFFAGSALKTYFPWDTFGLRMQVHSCFLCSTRPGSECFHTLPRIPAFPPLGPFFFVSLPLLSYLRFPFARTCGWSFFPTLFVADWVTPIFACLDSDLSQRLPRSPNLNSGAFMHFSVPQGPSLALFSQGSTWPGTSRPLN